MNSESENWNVLKLKIEETKAYHVSMKKPFTVKFTLIYLELTTTVGSTPTKSISWKRITRSIIFLLPLETCNLGIFLASSQGTSQLFHMYTP